jgi:chromosome segregation ATPase
MFRNSDLSEISTVIGELRAFSQQQAATNLQTASDLQKILERSDRGLASSTELNATFIEFRKTLHERFSKLQEQIGHIDGDLEELQKRVDSHEVTIQTWKGSWKVAAGILCAASAVVSAIVSHYGNEIVKVIAQSVK